MAILAGLYIETVKTCIHLVDLAADCDACAQIKPRKPGGAYPSYRGGYHGTQDEVTGRWIPFGGSEFVPCPHGQLIPFDKLSGKLPTATKYKSFCDACEDQRKAGRVQEDAVHEALKALPRARKVPKKHQDAYQAAHAAWLAGEIADFHYDFDGQQVVTEPLAILALAA